MISFVSLLFLYTAKTTSALEFHSPIRIVRPIDDVHTNCDRDVQKMCSQINTHIQQGQLSYSHGYLPETNEDAIPSPRGIESSNASGNAENDKTLGYDPTYASVKLDEYIYDQSIPSDVSEDMKEGEDARRLNEVESKKVSTSRTYSISAGIRISPKKLEDSTQHSKDNKRFLNYGPSIDMCLWNAFDAQHVSSQCASALAYLNSSDDPSPYHYTDKSEPHKTYTKISISFSGVTFCTLILCYLLIKHLLFDECDDDMVEDQIDSEQDGYQCLDESKSIAFVAVPVQTA